MAANPTTPTKKTTSAKTQTEAGKAFAKWAEERSKMTEDQIFALEAEAQGLTPTKKLKGKKPTAAQTTTFEQWAFERSRMTEDEIFALEAETQGLKEVKKPAVPPQKVTRPAPDLLISRTPYPKWWNDLIVGSIDITGNGTQVVVGGKGGRGLYVATIVLVVSGETNISFGFGGSGASGSMYFGGGVQPGGIVISMSDSPAPCGSGGFSVSATGGDPADPPHIGGFAVCFSEAYILPA